MKIQVVRFCILLGLSIPLGTVWGLTLFEVELKELSSSGKSIVVDQGEMEEFKEGNYARFYVQKGTLNEPVVFLVAEGELIKSTPRKSYWFMRKIHIPEGMKNQNKLLLLTSEAMQSGRPLKLKVRQRVANKDEYQDVDDFLAQNKENVPSRLIRFEKNYDASEEMFDKDEVPEADVEITAIDSYRDKSQKYFSEEYGDLTAQRYFIGHREVRLGDIKHIEDKKLFDSMAFGYQEKVASMKYGVKDFYRDTAKEDGMHEFNKALTIKSTYDQAREDKKAQEIISPRAIAKVERDGENWSADMDTTSLRKYFISTGLEREVRRREIALNELDGNEVMFHYSGSIVDQSTETDPNYRGYGYQLGLGYDLHLSRTNPDLKQWSLQFFLERGVVNTDIGGKNGRSEEGFYGAYVNYYFINNPLTLNSFIYLAGVGLKFGSADITSHEMEKAYTYQVLTLPSLQLMGKYRFRTGDLAEDTVNVGASANFGMNLDFKNYSTQDNLEDDINGKFSNTDLKYYLGMSVYF
jgi:hypothetical protein